MESTSPISEDEIPGIRKRKWLPLGEDFEGGSSVSKNATEANDDDTTPGISVGSDAEASHKRIKLQDTSTPVEVGATPKPAARESPQVSSLPIAVWHRICSFLEPTSLGRLICVDRALNALLDPKKPNPGYLGKKGLTQNDVWSASRKRLLPGFPRPLSWLSELDNWRLITGTSCQFCGRKQTKPNSITQSPWTAGPGHEGIRIIWPFGVRSCGKCLPARITKDADLRFTDISVLLPGLPYAYFTPDLDFVTSITLRASSPPPGLELTRYYFLPQVDHLKQGLDHASLLGQAVAAEWVKGRDAAGQEMMEDAKRFELWEATGGLQALSQSRVPTILPAKHSLPAKPAFASLPLPSVPAHLQAKSIVASSRTPSPLATQHRPNLPPAGNLSSFNTPLLPLKPTSPAPGQQPTTHAQLSNSLSMPQGLRGKSDRSVGEVNQRKADRRAEIERRCLLLNPPIQRSTLPYMEAFNNAMQISMTLNDNAWEVLKPRLISQHDAALKKENGDMEVNKGIQPQAEQRRENENQLRQAQTLIERQHDELQRPVREKLSAYADELLKSDWDNGAGVVKENAPQFAADLLIYVRRKFFEALEESDRVLEAQDAALASNSPGGFADRRLTLEDMKWIYEAKVKPITQRYSKEIFLCGACDIDRKHYALDAVIQHYAAKHTHQFSHGSAVVYWKADWPLEPPFDPNPIRSPRSRPVDHNGVSPTYQRDFGRQHHIDPVPGIPVHTFPGGPGVSMTPDIAPRALARYAASAYSVDEDLYQPRARLVPVQGNVPRATVYANGAGYESHFVPVTPVSPAFSPHGLATGSYRGYPTETSQRPLPVYRYDLSMMSPIGPNGYGSQPLPISQTSRFDGRPPTQPGQPAGFHQIQIAELARNAREIWDRTEGIIDLPDSVRTHVIIHHVVLRFHEKYTNEPTLALFTDALINNSHMKPLKSLEGLECNACSYQDNSTAGSGHDSSPYKLTELLRHFQTDHIEGVVPPVASHSGLEIPRPDWKFDMIRLPDSHTIKSLTRCSGMTTAKLSLIATVLSRYFEDPIPILDRTPPPLREDNPVLRSEAASQPRSRPPSPIISKGGSQDYISLDPHDNNLDRPSARMIPDHQRAELMADERRENEYDPNRPIRQVPGPVLDYESAFQQPRSIAREAQWFHPSHDIQHVVPPSYRPAAPDTPRMMFHDRYYAPQNRYMPPRSRYVEDGRDIQSHYRPPTSQYTYRTSLHGDDARLEDEREAERPHSIAQQVKVEDMRSPAREQPTGATQFLNNFNIESSPADRHTVPDEGTLADRLSNNASSNRTGRNIAGARRHRDRLGSPERAGTETSSRKGTPRKGRSRGDVSARSRSPSVSPREGSRYSEADPYLRRPMNAAFDREPPQQAQYSEPRYFERPIYEDELIPQHYVPVARYRTRSPVYDQQNMPLRYVEARPLPVYRYSDEVIYEQPGREYVQVMPRGDIEHRIAQENYPEYVERSGEYARPADGRDVQPYREAPLPPRRPIRYEPYDDRR